MSAAGIVAAALLGASPALSHAPTKDVLKCPLGAPYDASNPFTAVIRGEKKEGIVYSDPLLIAFVPIGWDNPGEVLVIPRRFARNVNDLNDAELLAILHLARRLARAQERAFGSTGFTIEENNGRHQSVCHAHFHVIPNTPTQHVKNAAPAAREAIASRLRAALSGS